MNRRHVIGARAALLAACLTMGIASATQATDAGMLARADSAWTLGDHAAAAEAYRHVLASDSTSVRALLRLGLLASWRDDLATALPLLQRARALEPADLDIQLSEARILSWMSRFEQALAAYDSILTRFPDSEEASLGRARTLSWAGRLDHADSAYARIARQHPRSIAPLLGQAQVAAWRGEPHRSAALYLRAQEMAPLDPDVLTGLARARLGEGRAREARRVLQRALAADSTHRDALALRAEVDLALRPRLEMGLVWSEDSDGNVTWSQWGGSSLWLAPGLTASAAAGVLEASDPARHASRRHGEFGLSAAHASRQLSAAVGVRSLRLDGTGERSLPSGRLLLTQRVNRSLTLGADWSRTPLDETAVLIGRGLSASVIGASLEASLAGRLGVSVSAGRGELSDGNRRQHGVIGVDGGSPRRLRAGLLARQLSYDVRGQGYFSPDRFRLIEARLLRTWERGAWSARLEGGLGGQQTARGAPNQAEWHLGGRVGRRWAKANRFEVFFETSEGGWRAESGAYRHRAMGASLALGL